MSDLRTETADAAPSLFERIGGVVAIGPLVAQLYERVRADPELAPYLNPNDRPIPRRTFTDLLTDALGGPGRSGSSISTRRIAAGGSRTATSPCSARI